MPHALSDNYISSKGINNPSFPLSLVLQTIRKQVYIIMQLKTIFIAMIAFAASQSYAQCYHTCDGKPTDCPTVR